MTDMFEELVADVLIEMLEDGEIAMSISGAKVEMDSGLWWAVPAELGDPPMGYPFTKKYLAEQAVRDLTFSGELDYVQKAIIPGRAIR